MGLSGYEIHRNNRNSMDQQVRKKKGSHVYSSSQDRDNRYVEELAVAASLKGGPPCLHAHDVILKHAFTATLPTRALHDSPSYWNAYILHMSIEPIYIPQSLFAAVPLDKSVTSDTNWCLCLRPR